MQRTGFPHHVYQAVGLLWNWNMVNFCENVHPSSSNMTTSGNPIAPAQVPDCLCFGGSQGQLFPFFFSCCSCGGFQGHPSAVSLFFGRLSGPALPFFLFSCFLLRRLSGPPLRCFSFLWAALRASSSFLSLPFGCGPHCSPRLNTSELLPSTFQLHGMPSFA